MLTTISYRTGCVLCSPHWSWAIGSNFSRNNSQEGKSSALSIARALINDPTLILADEPTANLDSKIGHEIMRLLHQIAKEQNRSVVIVSHDQRIQDIADCVLWLEDGAFKEVATMATDPVCGMKVGREKAVTEESEGQTYSFCSRGCRNEFLEEPQQFCKRRAHSRLKCLDNRRTLWICTSF